MMKTKYKNPWHRTDNSTYGPAFYEHDKKPIVTHRGVSVYKVFEGRYDYVLNDVCITQRAGASKPKDTIDSILDGTDIYSDRAMAIANAA